MSAVNTVSVQVPLKAEYVGIVRLTASGIASRIGFDIDTIEDIKVALSEVLSRIIEKAVQSERVAIDFECMTDGMTISFLLGEEAPFKLFDKDMDNFAFAIISTLMDEVNIYDGEHVLVTMTKKLGKAV